MFIGGGRRRTMDSDPTKRCCILPVQSRRDLRRFIDYPYRLHRDAPYWVPPLRLDMADTLSPKKNPFFAHGRLQAFVAVDDTGKVVGRIAGIVNGQHLEKYDDKVGFFGFLECEERYETAGNLLDAAAAWILDQGLTAMRGPANPTLNDTAGLLVDGFDRKPSLLMPYNPPYYEEYLLRWGLGRVMTMWAYYLHAKFVRTERLRRGAAIVHRRNPGLSIRTVDMSRFDEELRIVREIFNEAWADNWGFVPITEAEFAHLARRLKQILDPRMLFLVEKDGEPVAFVISIPNVNQALHGIRNGRLLPFGILKLWATMKLGSIREVRIPLMGVRKKYQGRALDVLAVLETIEKGLGYGYEACEMGWVLDHNHVLRNLMEAMGGVVDKEYALFEKSLA